MTHLVVDHVRYEFGKGGRYHLVPALVSASEGDDHSLEDKFAVFWQLRVYYSYQSSKNRRKAW